jgi:hypothetical protein
MKLEQEFYLAERSFSLKYFNTRELIFLGIVMFTNDYSKVFQIVNPFYY